MTYFGVLTMIVDGELFWGEDSLDELYRFLGGVDPLDPERLQRWRELPLGVTRPRP